MNGFFELDYSYSLVASACFGIEPVVDRDFDIEPVAVVVYSWKLNIPENARPVGGC